MILSPFLSMGFMIATLVGSLAHLILGGNGRRFFAFLIAAWVGFALGQGTGDIMAIDVLSIGPIKTFAGGLGAIIGVSTAAILASRQP